MKIYILSLLIQVLALVNGFSSGFELRRERILKFYIDSVQLGRDKIDFFVLTAKIKFGKDLEKYLHALDSLILNPGVGDMFFAYQLIGLYMHCKEVLPTSYRDKIKNVFKRRTIYRGDTENHWLMYYIAWYLISQEWKGETWSNLKTSEENFHESEEYINFWIDKTTSSGQMEFDSPTYIIAFVPPLCVLYDFAQDTLMKKKAQMMLEYILVDYAVEYLKGCYCGAHSRDYPDLTVKPLEVQAQALGYLYFGETDFNPKAKEKSTVIFCAMSNFKPPEIIYHIATDRSIPYEHRERKRVRNVIRFGKERNPVVYKYTYMTSRYCIGSLQGGILQPIQQHSWDITFEGGGTVFSVHPYFSEIELGMFFPEEVKILPELVDRAHKVYRSPDKLSSSSPYERIFQYKGTLIALYNLNDMKEEEKYRHVNIFVSGLVASFKVDSSGWIYGRFGDAFFGLRIIGGFSEMLKDSAGYRFKVYGDKICLIVETGDIDEFGSFENFTSSLKATLSDFRVEDFSVIYKSLHGFEMFFSYDGKRFIDGKKFEMDWGLFEGRFIGSRDNGKVVEMIYMEPSGKIIKRILDFNKFEIFDELK